MAPRRTHPAWGEAGFTCPLCHYHAQQRWYSLMARGKESERRAVLVEPDHPRFWSEADHRSVFGDTEEPLAEVALAAFGGGTLIANLFVSECTKCKRLAVWAHDRVLYPRTSAAPPANDDLPGDVRADYEEAAMIMDDSPRAAAALLRLALQRLCEGLGAKGDSLNDYITKWAATGLDPRVEKALDSVRVVGNHAVHPGRIDLGDARATVETLFSLVNYIAEKAISEPRRVDEFFDKTVPPDERARIGKRRRPPR